MNDAFSALHPVVTMAYFLLVLGFTMFLLHPACLLISLVCALIYAVYQRGKRALRFHAFFILPMLVFTALVNPLFNHEGGTILRYLPDGNPLTLESIAYGAAAAVMLAAVVGWFGCFHAVMTSDKLIYLFGRMIPALSLIFSMSLRLVPRFQAQLRIIRDAQRGIGRGMTGGSLPGRARQGARMVSILVTWALENAIQTADSMKGRGFGLGGRTAFSIFSFDRRDGAALAFLLLTGGYIALGAAWGGLYFRFFPTIKGVEVTPHSVSLLLVYLALCLMPVLLNAKEDFKWRAIRSKI